MTLADYQKAFRREVYALMKDAYEESFTPGSDSVRTPTQPIMMKPDFYRLMADIAVKKLARGGVKAPAGFSVASEQKSAFNEGGRFVKNPIRKNSTPRMFDEMYETFSFIKEFFKGDAELERQFKSSVQHLVSLYGIPLSKKAFGNGKQSEEQLKETVMYQYRCYVMSGILLKMVELSFAVGKGQIEEILSLMNAKNLSVAQLDKSRVEFSKAFHNLMNSVFGEQKLGYAIIGKLNQRKSLPEKKE